MPTNAAKGNTNAIISMVVGLFALMFFWFPFFGLILGLWAVTSGACALKNGTDHPGMAVTGLIFGGTVTLIQLFALVAASVN